MEPGIFTKTFVRPTLAAVLDAIAVHGLRYTQFNLACAGLSSMPDEIDPADLARIRREFDTRGLTISALSGTFNMIHPDPVQRRMGLRRLAVLAAACSGLGTSIITLCTGTRDPEEMWRYHPDNGTQEAWRDLLKSMETALVAAEAYDVVLAFEPEPANVVDRAAKGRRLLDELRSPHVKVVMDGANLFHPGELPEMAAIMDAAFDLLGPDVALAHAKDLDRNGRMGHVGAGQGCLDFDRYIALLARAGYEGPLIMHSLPEDAVSESAAFLRGKLGGD